MEIQNDSADLARRSVCFNHLEEKITIIEGDIKEASSLFHTSYFDVVTSNPPYMIAQHGFTNPKLPKAIARHEILCTLEDVIREGAKVLKPNGHFFLVHRPFRLPEIFAVMQKYKIEPKRIRDGKPRLTVEKPLIIFQEKGVYTKEIYDIYGY